MAEPAKTRRPKARKTETILAALDERLLMLDSARDVETMKEHASRVEELCDELTRSLSKNNGGDDE